MLSKSNKSFVKSLSQKKYRLKNKLFVAEGVKIVDDLLQSNFKLNSLFASEEWYRKNHNINQIRINIVNDNELKSISKQQKPNQVLGIFEIPTYSFDENTNKILLLDSIRDPGNLGTILRTADWYGIKNIFCSNDCVDVYNPKVIQSSMGSIANVKVFYEKLDNVMKKYSHFNFYATTLNGYNINNENFKFNFPLALIIGNEANGLSSKIVKLSNVSVSLESYGKAESLNAAVATAIFLDRISINMI